MCTTGPFAHYTPHARVCNGHVSLPPGTREEDVTAIYKDGVLEVRAPAPEQAPATEKRKIRVSRN